MTRIKKLTDRHAVDDALVEFDEIGREAFLDKYGFGKSTEYFLVDDRGHYDSKPVFAAAYLREHGVHLGNDDFSGGVSGAAAWLEELGYAIDGLDRREGRQTFDMFEAAMDAFALPVENMTAAREFVADKDFDRFYIPPSGTYIAMLARGDQRPSAWVHVGFITTRAEDGTMGWFALPYNRVRGGGSARTRRQERAEKSVCATPGCGMLLPQSAVCDYC